VNFNAPGQVVIAHAGGRRARRRRGTGARRATRRAASVSAFHSSLLAPAPRSASIASVACDAQIH
jgi:hypothetical protein